MNKLNREIMKAVRRGVKLSAVLNFDHPTGKITRINAQTQGVLQSAGACVKLDTRAQLTHSKMLIIDGEITVIGSHNYSERSMNSNNEASVIIFDRLVAQKYKYNFEQIFNRN
jgi:cardiolipin synthase